MTVNTCCDAALQSNKDEELDSVMAVRLKLMALLMAVITDLTRHAYILVCAYAHTL